MSDVMDSNTPQPTPTEAVTRVEEPAPIGEPAPTDAVTPVGEPAPTGEATRVPEPLVARELTLDSGIFYRRWEVEAPRAVVLIVHGLGEHSGRYQHVAEALAARGYACLAPDHPGHGRSPGHRCYIGSFDGFYPALDALRDIIDADYPGLPCFIIGHSMGGLITGNYLLTRQSRFAGAAFSGAAFEVPEPPSAAAIFINKIIAVFLPRLGVLQLDASQVSRDAEVVQRYRDDPLVHSGKISARLVVEFVSY